MSVKELSSSLSGAEGSRDRAAPPLSCVTSGRLLHFSASTPASVTGSKVAPKFIQGKHLEWSLAHSKHPRLRVVIAMEVTVSSRRALPRPLMAPDPEPGTRAVPQV